ncbi:hypothetical protein A2W45_03780 [Candidatus Curtissbacteria bacterium RIFCSPHIGHO2_12_41_11]|uniref:Uncharacterized protein n=2 Tax=Candidatus Curtissiibacteriota TaxID=1752717 RepID=A0A1F5HQI8_9BACT|nr:MAG: hypothetical protein A2W45_03780 [Candidatus Curtissbacteria bacterium RIFCSPHIGHO2_12_41_11]OGE06362.1 MAG: hypothetical protein A2W70_01675 [Candidatus Curtissbacteria bacterium RIFCSPLOWO2_02_41_11]
MGILGRREVEPMSSPPEGFFSRLEDGWDGDESTGVPEEQITRFSNNHHRIGQHPDESLPRPPIGMGRDTTL